MSTTYQHPWYSAQLNLGSITTLESESTQKPNQEVLGQTLTDPNFRGDLFEHIVIVEAMKRGAHVYKNIGCTGKTDMILEKNGEKISIDVKSSTRNQASAPGVFLVLVDVESHEVTWGNKRRQPTNWEQFWS